VNLNLGCGRMSYPDAVNLDAVAMPGVDVVHDLAVAPWPFDDETFAEVWASNIFEHIADPLQFMAECWRILEPDGLLLLLVPDWRSENAFTDPTHRRFCTERTFDYWCPGTDLHAQFSDQFGGERVRFVRESVKRSGEDLIAHLRRC
jgi:SAM-dependent methyltransferase